MIADFSDKLLHYALFMSGGFVMTVVKKGYELLAERFWNSEYEAFQKWKKEHPKRSSWQKQP